MQSPLRKMTLLRRHSGIILVARCLAAMVERFCRRCVLRARASSTHECSDEDTMLDCVCIS